MTCRQRGGSGLRLIDGPVPLCNCVRVTLMVYENKIDQLMVEAIVNVAKALGKKTVAEFVEYDERIYDWCLGGKTTHDANGESVEKTGKEPAKAGDWYNWAEQKMLM